MSEEQRRPFRVLHVAEPRGGGVARYLIQVALDQAAHGWSVSIATPPDSMAVAALQGTDVRLHPWSAEPGPSPRTLSEAYRLAGIVKDAAPDVLHLHSSKAGLVGRLITRGRIPTLYQPHAWAFLPRGTPMRQILRGWERLAASRWSRAVVCVSEEEREIGLELGIDGGALVTVPNGVDLERFPAAHPEERAAARAELGLPPGPLVVCVARLHRQKGQHFLLDAWPRVRAAVPEARLALVGDGPGRDDLAARADASVLLAGRTDRAPRWYAAADVVVLPSVWEGLALTSLEALATARALVITQVSGSRLIAEAGAGAVVPHGDTTALADALVARLRDPALAAAEGTAGRTYVERHHDVSVQQDRLREVTARAACVGRLRVHVVAAHGVLGGSEGWLLDMLDARDDLDVSVTLMQDGPFRSELERRGIPVTLLPTGRRPRDLARVLPAVTRTVRGAAADVVVGNGAKAQLVAAPAARLAGLPSVWVKHDLSRDRTLAPALGRLSTRVIGTDAAVLEAVGRRDAVVVHPPRPRTEPEPRHVVRDQLRAWGVPDGEPELWLGMAVRLVPFKGVEDAVRALAEPAASRWRLVVLGDDDPSAAGETDRLRAVANAVGVAHRVHFLGRVPQAARWLGAFDALALLTRPAGRGPGKEGFGGVAMEAMIAGVPVIAVAGSPAAKRAGQAAGRAVHPGDPRDVARALGELADAEVRVAAGRAARDISAGHPDAATCAADFVAVLRDTVRGRLGGRGSRQLARARCPAR
jgi:glycosyltransferase involved in cell wall biosynthesis